MEVPTLESLMAKKIHFPTRIIPKCSSAICFLCAAFYGQYDAVNLRKIRNVSLVDLNEEKMEGMKTIYPASWKFIVGDYVEEIDRQVAGGNTYDLVTCDPWSHMVEDVLITHFKKLYSMSNKFFLPATCQNTFLSKHNVAARKGPLSKFLSETHGLPVKVTKIIKRSDFEGGFYWILIKKR